jgi:hypothetical protein
LQAGAFWENEKVSAGRIEIDDVRSALSAQLVVDAFGWKVRREGAELVSSACPARADHSREAFKINSATGRWQCFVCGTAGDLFDFIAGVERWSVRDDFAKVLAKAGEIAGVGPSIADETERAAKRAEFAKRRAEAELRDQEERARRDSQAVPTATAYWNQLPTTHERGLQYLAQRAVDEVRECFPDLVRFDPKHNGSPAIKLYSSDGSIRNVVARRVPELGEPKTPGLKDCPTAGTFINAICQIETDRDVVITEGVVDSLTARLMWHEAIVLGAHGAGNLAKIGSIAAKSAALARTRIIIVPHQDKTGWETAMAVCRLAVDAGLSFRRGTLHIVQHGHKDLNDAWRAGWRAYS